VQLVARWNALPRAIRTTIAVAAAVALVATIVLGAIAHPSRLPLFASALHPEQLAEVQERLASWNVPFTPTADNVIVDSGRRNDLLLRLSLSGIPHEHLETTGEALASIGMLTPQAVIEAQTRAGLAGDIEAGLRGIDGIDDARVIIAPAKPAEFGDETRNDASASVRIALRPGTRLSSAAVNGIRSFVSAAVTGLDPQRVTILDDRGVALGDAGDGEEAAQLQESLQSALDAAFGAGSAIVRVRAEYAADRVDRRDVRRAPLGAQAIAHSARTESYVDGGKRYRHDDVEDDRGSETRETFVQTPPGSIRRISAGIFVDESRAVDLAKVRDLAAAVLAYDPRRGDTLCVQAVDFHHSPVARKDVWWLLYGTIVPLAPAVALAIGSVVALRLALPSLCDVGRSWLERAAMRDASRSVSDLAPAHVRRALIDEPPHAAAAIISALPTATAAAVLELYPQHEREAIVRRMQRPQNPLLGDLQEYLRRHG
jgi:flagellar biosynthesis/type III secretory pathway M-ring protein FliF/YscJ